jgi:hypothetical protein
LIGAQKAGFQFEAAGGHWADLSDRRDASAPPRAELSASAHMRVRMPVGSRVAMSMRLGCKLGWNHNDAAITDATFGNDAVSEPPDVRGAALQHGHFHAMVMIEMNVKGRLRQIMTAMGRPYEPLGQIADRMVVYENERADARATLSCVLCRLLNSGAGKVADRLRSILVSPPFDDTVKVRHQVVVESNRNTLHNEFT